MPQRFQELVCNFPVGVLLLCPSPTFCFPIVIGSEALTKREDLWEYVGNSEKEGSWGHCIWLVASLGGWGTPKVGQGDSSLDVE